MHITQPATFREGALDDMFAHKHPANTIGLLMRWPSRDWKGAVHHQCRDCPKVQQQQISALYQGVGNERRVVLQFNCVI